jgi:hypothetical protein
MPTTQLVTATAAATSRGRLRTLAGDEAQIRQARSPGGLNYDLAGTKRPVGLPGAARHGVIRVWSVYPFV